MASIKATLTVALKANDVVVAELEDPALWQRVLAAINVGDPAAHKPEPPSANGKEWSAWSEQVK
ncbi:MAG TPA: hypothetical protein VJV22_07660 [Acidobacteriaceae bacterium]|nr:hypothetical protein [Acidobacteriaceae bacterium]